MRQLKELYHVPSMPIFQNVVYSSKASAQNCPTADILLVQDRKTGLVFNDSFIPELVQYGSDYQNEQAFSGAFREHLNTVSQIINENFKNHKLNEIGCGKGFFLELLQKQGFDITGLDPTYNGNNPNIIKSFFSEQLNLAADGLILRHVLEHVQNPLAFLKSIKSANQYQGKIYIEVPCFDWILKHRAWFDIFYEHVNYFRLSDFYHIFDHIYTSGYLFGGQYLYVVADLSSLNTAVYSTGRSIEFPKEFASSINYFTDCLNQKQGQSVVWGASSKGVIFAIFMQRAGALIDYVVDINPMKQGRYLPVTGLKVDAPMITDQFPSSTTIFVMNSNYIDEIKTLTQNKFNYIEIDNQL